MLNSVTPQKVVILIALIDELIYYSKRFDKFCKVIVLDELPSEIGNRFYRRRMKQNGIQKERTDHARVSQRDLGPAPLETLCP